MSSSSATNLVLDSSVSPTRTRPYSTTSSGSSSESTSRSASTSGKSASVPTGLWSSTTAAIRSLLANMSCGIFGRVFVRPSVRASVSRLTDCCYGKHMKYRVAGCALLLPPPFAETTVLCASEIMLLLFGAVGTYPLPM